MFGLFKKNKKETTVSFHAVAKGTAIPLEAVGDGVFSSKMLGDGYAVKPETEEVFAPVVGKVVSVFPTKHAITIETEEGLEILVHMGIDTVELKGEPFEVFVTEGQAVTPATKLANMDLAKLAETNTTSTIVVVVTNMDKVSAVSTVNEHAVAAQEEVATVTVA
ncbi:PTS sugar transporter subunit IIA [Vagococcus xieshaowenii]|uniref:PTS glucose transporter subunit IIA n=1 Tax=Vagococcus xieshaowenii TaxID=2562451 RepID=A0AAJ5JKV6_9ENTE|nr:PTS glucose transporter subunit IIA [Vagococcus xieshaowenii]QCA29366.1 PTS glucose transporter subunit IIA [Vagococcus xieshaowenii]TFZ39342.1 PTS glucose transporter subunit IIA [Vagococcus xieshaowenii]